MDSKKKIKDVKNLDSEKLLELSTLKPKQIKEVQNSLSEKLDKIDEKIRPASEWIERHRPEKDKEFPRWLELKNASTDSDAPTHKIHLEAEYLQLQTLVANYGYIKDLIKNTGGMNKEKYIDIYEHMSENATKFRKDLEYTRIKYLYGEIDILYENKGNGGDDTDNLKTKMQILEQINQKKLYNDINTAINDLSAKKTIIGEMDREAKALLRSRNRFEQGFNENERKRHMSEFSSKYGYMLVSRDPENISIRNHDDYRHLVEYMDTTKQCFWQSVDQYGTKEQELRVLEEGQKLEKNSKQENQEIGKRIFKAIEETVEAMGESLSYGREAMFVEKALYRFILTNFRNLKEEYSREHRQVEEVVNRELELVRGEKEKRLADLQQKE